MLMEVDVSSGNIIHGPVGLLGTKSVVFHEIFNMLEAWLRTRRHAKHA
jgi:hypothetical protein